MGEINGSNNIRSTVTGAARAVLRALAPARPKPPAPAAAAPQAPAAGSPNARSQMALPGAAARPGTRDPLAQLDDKVKNGHTATPQETLQAAQATLQSIDDKAK